MSNDNSTRHSALTLAVAAVGPGATSSTEIVDMARDFNAFLTGDDAAAPAAQTASPAPARGGRRSAPQPAPAVAPTTSPSPPPPKGARKGAQGAGAPAGDDEETKAKLVAAIGKLAKANRAECVKILAEFGAQSASSVAPEDYEACLEKINAAVETGSADLTS